MKLWWKDEPLIVGSLRWRIIDNDLRNNIKAAIEQIESAKTLEEAAAIAHSKDLKLSFELIPL